MRIVKVGVFSVVFGGGLLAGGALAARAEMQPRPADQPCGASAKVQLRTTLYFGLARPKGSVSELEWQVFLRDEVTARVCAAS